ncbi:hypothetical protein FBPa19_0077 [Pseudomonas phage vB_PaeP_FBPa19]|uniref:Uncharacterized protein n=1 Tax=Pseudomonas phage vB_PaeP_FBPa42 TaxID=3231240 RepID=A0AAU8KXN4_9VIRU|nr:hypothetical protein FBPa19_0077 [Pseudomonas phage vB_PaeP_FBPa19]
MPRDMRPPIESSAENRRMISPRMESAYTPKLERISRCSRLPRPFSRPVAISERLPRNERPWYFISLAATGRSVNDDSKAPPSLEIDCQARTFAAIRAAAALPGIRVWPLTSRNRFVIIPSRAVLKFARACGSPPLRTSSLIASRAMFRLASGFVPSRRIRAVFWPDRSRPRNTASRRLPVP